MQKLSPRPAITLGSARTLTKSIGGWMISEIENPVLLRNV